MVRLVFTLPGRIRAAVAAAATLASSVDFPHGWKRISKAEYLYIAHMREGTYPALNLLRQNVIHTHNGDCVLP
jgi:hypothetical protein